jgi:hypothetical protein
MQGANFRKVAVIHFQEQATRVLPLTQPGRVTDAVNDDQYRTSRNVVKMALRVFANTLGGAVFLSGLLLLPYLISMLMN